MSGDGGAHLPQAAPREVGGARPGHAGRVVVVLLTAVVVVVTWAATATAFFAAAVAVGSVSGLVVTAVGVGLLVACLAAWPVSSLLTRPRRYVGGVALGAVGLLVLVAAPVLLVPLPSGPAQGTDPPTGAEYWQLATGSRLAYLRVPAHGTPRQDPIVVVGGGPGEAAVTNETVVDLFGRFARLGYDVYVYDQVGAGLSERLANPAGYTVGRHVADLEAIRQQIGADRLVLMGSSWGGSLVASYLSRYPEHVARAVFTSPGPMDYAQWPGVGDPASRLPAPGREEAEALIPGNLRFLLWYGLGEINPVAARDLAPDTETDAFFDTYLELVAPATVCDPENLPATGTRGNGLHVNRFTSRSAQSGAQAGVPGALASIETPSLVLTGGCDYLPWDVPRQYATTLPEATLLCFPDAGHVIHLDRPDAYERAVAGFLAGEEPSPWPADRPCG